MTTIQCFSCGAETDDIVGPTHKYLLSTPGCWARYGDVLAKEYSDFAYMAVHQLTVDAYSAQHPGQPNPQTIGSINIHLCSLYAHFKQDVSINRLPQLKSQLAQHKQVFTWLEPPQFLGQWTINEVWLAENPKEHREFVEKWANDVFTQWESAYPVLQTLLQKVL